MNGYVASVPADDLCRHNRTEGWCRQCEADYDEKAGRR